MTSRNIFQQGYGGFLTKISLEQDIVDKKSINPQGDFKIKKEINFYNFVKNKPFQLYVPSIIEINDNAFKMEYLTCYTTLEKYFRKCNNNNHVLEVINFIKNILEEKLYIDSINVDFSIFKENLYIETTGKILSRFPVIKPIIEKYNFIEKVNGEKLMNLDIILEKIDAIVDKYLNSCELLYYPIHGDLQLNNILINLFNSNIKFIDPRGYFGNSEIYGMKDYDLAKLYFGLGGYSYFDLKEVTTLNIDGNNIVIDMKEIINNISQLPVIVQIFIICIWLGNAHCFVENEFKVVESYFYSLYLSTMCLNSIN